MKTQDELYVSFVIYDFGVNPDQISAQLGLKPNETAKKGEVKGKNSRSLVSQNDIWKLTSKLEPSREINEHIQHILDILDSEIDKVKKVTSRYESHIKIGAYLHSVNSGVFLNQDVLKRLSEYSLSLDLDIYCLADKEQ